MRSLKIAAAAILALAMLAAAGAWLAVRDEVAALRSMSKAARTPPALVASAVLASEDPGFLLPGRFALRDLNCLRPHIRCCGPSSLSDRMTRYVSRRPTRMGRWHAETMLVSLAISHVFTPDELFAAYLHESYFGTVNGRALKGVEAAAAAYFAKRAPELSVAEAATVAAMMRAPNLYSPLKHPDRALVRRNLVLGRMRDRRVITEDSWRSAVAEPLRSAQP